jgi:glucose-induced degradation protein 4
MAKEQLGGRGHRESKEEHEEAVEERGDVAAKRRRLEEDRRDEDVPSIRGLQPGAVFLGVQQSGRATYEVEVQIQNVDLDKAFLCGYLKISGLTDEFPELTTYFEGEIICNRHTFVTQKWDADEATDREVRCARGPGRARAHARPVVAADPSSTAADGWPLLSCLPFPPPPVPSWQHWSKFAQFWRAGYADDMGLTTTKLDPRHDDYVFMRWKEHFLVPDHRITTISGASFAGFYYICFRKESTAIDGYYFHHSSEMYQSLRLKLQPGNTFGSFKLR